LPLFLQLVHGISPTVSGVYLLPQVLGLLLTSVGSGQLIARTGRYKIYPIIGTGLLAVALFLLSRLDERTSTTVTSVYFFVLGTSLRLILQVLVIAVQNSVDFADLGAATSGATFFRSIGGSFGVSVFGAIFSNRLIVELAAALRGVRVPPGFKLSSAQADPALLKKLPTARPGRRRRTRGRAGRTGLARRPAGQRGGVRRPRAVLPRPGVPLTSVSYAANEGLSLAREHREDFFELHQALVVEGLLAEVVKQGTDRGAGGQGFAKVVGGV
jgi:hypothetical protein